MKRMIGGKVWDTAKMIVVIGFIDTSEYGDQTALLYDEASGFSFFSHCYAPEGLRVLEMIEDVKNEVEGFLEKYNVEIDSDVEAYLGKIS